MELEKTMAGFMGFQEFDSSGVELMVSYCPMGKFVTISLTDKLYNGSTVEINGVKGTINGQSVELPIDAIASGDKLNITPPGGFTRSFPLNF